MSERLLIVKLSALGDVIAALPLATWIKSVHPDATIDWVIEKKWASLLKKHPAIDRTIAPDTKGSQRAIWTEIRALRTRRYDRVIDLQGNCKSALFTLFARSRKKCGYRFKLAPEWPNSLVTNRKFPFKETLPLRAELEQIFTHLFNRPPPTIAFNLAASDSIKLPPKVGPLIMVSPFSRWSNKELSPKTLREFLVLLEKQLKPTFILTVGTPQEKEKAHSAISGLRSAHILGPLDLAAWQGMIKEMDFVITVDSASLHLTQTTSVPCFAIFGPSSSHIYSTSFSVQGGCPYGETFVKRCPRLRTCPTGACLKDLTAKTLFNQFLEFAKCRVGAD